MSDQPPDTRPSPDAPEPAPIDPEDEAAFARAADQVSLNLRLKRYPEASRAAEEMLQRWPESTTAFELAGDAAYAIGRVAQARKHYHRALELEPANADAERKYGEALLAQTPDERRAALLKDVIVATASRTGTRRPLNAVLNAVLFPGLGQLYNRQQEKGLIILAAAALMLIVSLSVMMPYISATLTVSSPNARSAQVDSAQQVINDTGTTQWLLVSLCGLIYTGLWLWAIYDAWKGAQSETDRALGV